MQRVIHTMMTSIGLGCHATEVRHIERATQNTSTSTMGSWREAKGKVVDTDCEYTCDCVAAVRVATWPFGPLILRNEPGDNVTQRIEISSCVKCANA